MKKNPRDAWRRRSLWWGIPLLVCILNGLAILFYQARLAGNVQGWEDRVGAETKNQSALETDQRKSQHFLENVEQLRKDLQTLYDGHFSTPEKRLIKVTREVKELAQRAGLQPRTFNYPETELIGGELRQRNMVFSVQGTYSQLRTFINFLEVNDQFLTLERVSLTGTNESAGGAGGLSIQLRLSTVFVPEVKTRRNSTS